MRLKWTEAVVNRIALSLIFIILSFRRQIATTAAAAATQTHVTSTDVGDRSRSDSRGILHSLLLQEAPLKIAAVETNAFFMRHSTPTGDSIDGYLVDLVQEMAQAAHFRFEWQVVEEKEVNGRRKRKNGNTWMELTEKLFNGKVNASVLPVNSANINHAKRFSYTRPFLRSTLSVLIKAPTSPFDTRPWLLENLLNETDRSRFRFGVTNELVANQLKISNATLYQQIWNEKQPSEVVYSQEEGLRKVREGDFALLMESTEATYLSSQEPCDLLALDQFTHETSYVFATKRNSSLVTELDNVLARLESRDYFGELYGKWWGTDDCALRRDGSDDPDDAEDIDLDMERIFFTSPIKFFKSIGTSATVSSSMLPLVTGRLPVLSRSSSYVAVTHFPDRSTSLSLEKDVDEQERLHGSDSIDPVRVFEASYTVTPEVVGDSNRKRSRTHSTTTLPTRRARTEPGPQRKSQRRSRTKIRQTTTTPRHFTKTSTEEHWNEEDEDEFVSDTFTINYGALDSPLSPTSIPLEGSMGDADSAQSGQREEDSLDLQRSNFRNHGSSSPVTPRDVAKRPTKPLLGNDIDWFFVTHQPRISENILNYDPDAEYDEENAEQRVGLAVESFDVEDKTRKEEVSKVDEIIQKSSSYAIEIPSFLIVVTSMVVSLVTISIHCNIFHLNFIQLNIVASF